MIEDREGVYYIKKYIPMLDIFEEEEVLRSSFFGKSKLRLNEEEEITSKNGNIFRRFINFLSKIFKR